MTSAVLKMTESTGGPERGELGEGQQWQVTREDSLPGSGPGFWFLSSVTLRPLAAFLVLFLPVNCTTPTRPRSNVIYDMLGPVHSKTSHLG